MIAEGRSSVLSEDIHVDIRTDRLSNMFITTLQNFVSFPIADTAFNLCPWRHVLKTVTNIYEVFHRIKASEC